MAETSGGGGGSWWWAAASSAQLAAAIAWYRRGHGGDVLMPFKAFAVASLIVGAGATAAVGALRGSGIHEVDDVKEVGASVRRRIGAPSREGRN